MIKVKILLPNINSKLVYDND